MHVSHVAGKPKIGYSCLMPDCHDIIPHHRGSYIVGQYTDTRLNIAKESPFKIQRAIKDIISSNTICATPKDKYLLIKTTNLQQTSAILAATTFSNHDATFTLHRTLNTTQCTILTNTHKQTPLSSFADELTPQGVISLRRYSTKNNNTILQLTINITLPEHIHLQHIRYPTRLHVPLPLRCKKC